MGQIIVIGMNPLGKVPAALLTVNPGVGRQQAGGPRYCVLTGNIQSTGTMVPNVDILDLVPGFDVAGKVGLRGELAQQIAAAQQVAGIQIKLAPVLENAAATAASCTVTFATTATAAGVHTFYMAGQTMFVNVATGDSPTVQGDSMVTAFTAKTGLPATAVNASGVVTVTCANKGIRGNDYTLYYDPNGSSGAAPSATTVALASNPQTTIAVASNALTLPQATVNVVATAGFPTAGNAIVVTSLGAQTVAYTGVTGTTLTGCTGGTGTMTTGGLVYSLAYAVNPAPGGVNGVRLGGGLLTDDPTALEAVLQGTAYFSLGLAQNDSTNLTSWRAYNVAKAAIGTQQYEHMFFGMNGLLATAQSRSQAVNNHRFSCAWMQGTETHPSVLAASYAAIATQYDQVHPNQKLNGVVLPGVSPARSKLDWPTGGDSGTQSLALDKGVTPIMTTVDGYAIIVRAITCLSLRNAQAFWGCLDRGQARTPDMAAEIVVLAWNTDFALNNPWVNDDPGAGELPRPEQVATPRIWASYAQGILAAYVSKNWFSSVKVAALYDATGKDLLTQLDLAVTPQNHRLGGNLNQVV